jgi:thiamine biosynthesis lipoprotein
MTPALDAAGFRRRARPLLGTLVEVGVAEVPGVEGAFGTAFDAIVDVQRCLSRFDADSDLARFHALPCGGTLRMRPATQAVLAAAQELHALSGGLFDISLGSAPRGWRCEGDVLHKLAAETRLDAGGIAKGHAVDRAVQALQTAGCAAGWVNAGGDLRVFGELVVPVHLRDEAGGGVRHFVDIAQGAFATSHFGAGSRSALAGGMGVPPARAHLSVAAPLCLWADALTKVLALGCGDDVVLLARYQAQAWRH